MPFLSQRWPHCTSTSWEKTKPDQNPNMAKAGGASNAHLRVRLLEFALSVPLAALIVAVVWVGFMQQYFALQSAELHSDLLAQANSDAADAQGDAPAGASVVVEADKAALAGAGDGLQLPKSALQPLTDEQFRKLDEKSEAFMSGESTRQRFGNLLQAMDLQGPGLEVASTGKIGKFAGAVLKQWPTKKYIVVAGSSNVEVPEELETFREEGRLQIVAVSEDEAPGRFDNDYFSFIYINPTLRGIKYDLDDWFPKLHEGGLFAGKDYCASKGEKSDSPERFGQRPWCGTYRGGAKKGRSKAGFGKHVVKQVDKFAADVGRRAHFTLEGRDPGMVFDSDGLANPSWYFYK